MTFDIARPNPAEVTVLLAGILLESVFESTVLLAPMAGLGMWVCVVTSLFLPLFPSNMR